MWWQRARQAWEQLNRRTARASERFFRGSDILDDTRCVRTYVCALGCVWMWM